MSDEREEPKPELQREGRRLERLRLVSVTALPERYEDEEDPKPAA
jgi:hypothetical protein